MRKEIIKIRLPILLSVILASLLVTTLLLTKEITHGGDEIWKYDPWCDINDDGKIDMKDIATVARKFMTSGTPINKTALLLELQTRTEMLNATLLQLEARITDLEQKPRILTVTNLSYYELNDLRTWNDLISISNITISELM